MIKERDAYEEALANARKEPEQDYRWNAVIGTAQALIKAQDKRIKELEAFVRDCDDPKWDHDDAGCYIPTRCRRCEARKLCPRTD